MLTFYTIAVTQAFSIIGSRMTAIAIGIWVFSQTGKTLPLLLTAFFAELPGMLVGSVAGVLVDRWDRRRVLMLADTGQAAATLLLMVSFLSGSFQLWHLYTISLLQGIFSTFQQPASDAATTMLVPEQQRERANGILQMSFPLAGVIAPVLTGMLYALIGVPGILLVDLATFLAAAVTIYLVRIPQPKQTEEGRSARGHLLQELADSFRYIARRRSLLYFVIYTVFINFMLNGPLELAIPYLLSVTGSEAEMGGLMGVMSLGAFSGAALIAAWGGTRPRMNTILPGLLLTGLMFLVYGTARSPLLLGASLYLLMAPLPVTGALTVSILQVKTPPDMQGRIFATISQLGFLGSTTSFLLTGQLVDRILEPAVGSPGWRIFEPLLGRGPGAGIGLLQLATGVIIFSVTLGMYILPEMRRLEAILPDYEAAAEGVR